MKYKTCACCSLYKSELISVVVKVIISFLPLSEHNINSLEKETVIKVISEITFQAMLLNITHNSSDTFVINLSFALFT